MAQKVPADQLRTQCRFYTHLKQLALLKDAGLELTNKGAAYHTTLHGLAALLNSLPNTESEPTLPFQYVAPLLELTSDFRKLLTPCGMHLIDSNTLQNTAWGKKVTRQHRLALNRLTLALHATTRSQAKRHNSVHPLDATQRALPNPQALTGLTAPATAPRAADWGTLHRFLHQREPQAAATAATTAATAAAAAAGNTPPADGATAATAIEVQDGGDAPAERPQKRFNLQSPQAPAGPGT